MQCDKHSVCHTGATKKKNAGRRFMAAQGYFLHINKQKRNLFIFLVRM